MDALNVDNDTSWADAFAGSVVRVLGAFVAVVSGTVVSCAAVGSVDNAIEGLEPFTASSGGFKGRFVGSAAGNWLSSTSLSCEFVDIVC